MEWLGLLGEPTLLQAREDSASVRIVYDFALPAYPRASIRVTRRGQNVTLVTKAAETRAASDQGRLIWVRTRQLTIHDWKAVEERVSADDLWDAYTISEREIEHSKGAARQDGLCYLVELAADGKQRVLYDCDPIHGGEKRIAGLLALLEGFAKCT